MSSEVYSIENQAKFNVAMSVGCLLGKNQRGMFSAHTKEWTYDVEFANVARTIYEEVKDTGYNENEIEHIVTNYFTVNGLVKELLKAEEDPEHQYQDFWYGVECGAYFGMPNTASLKKADEAMQIFMDQMKYAYVHEVIEANELSRSIVTKFGEFKNLIAEPYGVDETFSLAKIEETDETYSLLGFDAPTADDSVWRFWVECGDSDGHAETYNAELEEKDIEYIKFLYKKERKKGEKKMEFIKKTQAKSLPKGWEWTDCADGSGSLRSPEGIVYYSYDKNERTYDGGISYTTKNGGSYSFMGTLEALKAYAEQSIKISTSKEVADTPKEETAHSRKRYTEVTEDGRAILVLKNASVSLDKTVDEWRTIHMPNGSCVVYGDAINKFKAYEDAEAEYDEKIRKLLSSYEGNKEDLRNIEQHIREHGCLDNGLGNASESFEQGYSNALEYVFAVLGIRY